MPPFAGTPEQLEGLVQFIQWETDKRPTTWPESRDERVLAQIKAWLNEAGTGPATGPCPPQQASATNFPTVYR